MIRISHREKCVVIPYRGDIAALLPHAKRFTWNDEDLLTLPHGVDETQLLRNLGLAIPAPCTEHYPFKAADGLVAFDKQILTTASIVMNSHSFVLNDMGTGKTRSAIWAHDYLQSIGRAGSMLVVAPLSTLVFTWHREVMRVFPEKRAVVLSGSAAKRRKLLDQRGVDIYIINHDGLKVIAPDIAARPDINVFCFDEAAAYRNARADRSKVARKLGATRKYVWAMTGSPTPSAPTDAYGLAWLVHPDKAPRSFVAFRHETMLQVSQFKWMPRKDASDTIAKTLSPAVRYTLDEITELPPVVIRDYEVSLGTRQRAVYDAWKDHASVLLREGTITAANGGVVFSKMLQTSLGWVYDNDGNAVKLDNQERIDALLDLIESADRKVLVFSPFKSATKGISEALQKEKVDFAQVTGDTPAKERAEIFTAFQSTPKYKVLNAHPECMSHGLTLTAADTVIWYGPVVKLETYTQANARITRVGQAHKQQIIRMLATPIERIIYRRLAARQDMQSSVLDIIAELTNGDQ